MGEYTVKFRVWMKASDEITVAVNAPNINAAIEAGRKKAAAENPGVDLVYVGVKYNNQHRELGLG